MPTNERRVRYNALCIMASLSVHVLFGTHFLDNLTDLNQQEYHSTAPPWGTCLKNTYMSFIITKALPYTFMTYPFTSYTKVASIPTDLDLRQASQGAGRSYKHPFGIVHAWI